MSLILEALKKSEQERRRERAPDLRTVHQPVLVTAPRVFRWRWLLIGLLVLNLNALGIWWLLDQRSQPASAAVVAPPTAVVRDNPVVASEPRTEAPAAMTAREAPQALPAPAPTLAEPPVRSLTELPSDVRASLPAMTYSFHVFSANPERRSIIINERRLREGDEIGGGWQLEEITEEGVVLAGAGERVYVPVLSQW